MTDPGHDTAVDAQAGSAQDSRPVVSHAPADGPAPEAPAPAGAIPVAGTVVAPPAPPAPPAPSAPPAPAAAGLGGRGGPVAGAGKAGREAEQPFWRWLLEFVVLVGLAVLLATGIKTWVVQPFFIPSGSMLQTLQIGDRVLVNKFIYRFTSPKYGQIVVFTGPQATGEDLIKRVIATGGQTVDIKDGYVYVDGKKLDEPYVKPANRDRYNLGQPVKVPKGYLWLMGDNRANSQDSRFIGPQPVDKVLGQAFVIYWPIEHLKGL